MPSHSRCDGTKDCKDGSDERGCVEQKSCEDSKSPPNPSCSRMVLTGVLADGQFACTSGECLDRRFVCDGNKHCRDGSDEFNCDESTFALQCS